MSRSSKSQAKGDIQRAIDQVSVFISEIPSAGAFAKWRRDTRIAIASAFGENSGHVGEFIEIKFGGFEIGEGRILALGLFRTGLDRAKGILESMFMEIDEHWSDDGSPQSQPGGSTIPEQQVSNRVFVVHGRAGGTRDTVARYLETLKLEAVILQEQASEGRTTVEKLEDYSDVRYAVVLCTPDDVGALATERDKLRPRPRQNVVLELGFFLGKLGRNRVCALKMGDMEMPSDYDGVVYILLDDSEGWKLTLWKELNAAGLPVDMKDL